MTTACWLWNGTTRPDGYGIISGCGAGRGNLRAHRYSLELRIGPIHRAAFVLHECDNPACVNPDHLHLGTNADNMREMGDRERSKFHKARFRGQAHGMSRLTDDSVREIRARRATGETLRSIADAYGVAVGTICFVVDRKTWSHVA